LEGVRSFSLQSRAAKASGKAHSQPVSILLAEDNPPDARLVRRALEEHGVEGELIVIADGEKAIEFIQASNAEAGPVPRPCHCGPQSSEETRTRGTGAHAHERAVPSYTGRYFKLFGCRTG
jgi:hypothetical protein